MTPKARLERQLKALADGTRLRVVNLLLQGEICGCDIGHVLHLSQPNIAQHLAYLRHSGLVSSRREGYRVYYRLVEKRDRVLSGLLEPLRLAFDSDPIFVGDTRRLKKAIEDGICATQSALNGGGASRKARSGKPNREGRTPRGRRGGDASADSSALVALQTLPSNREQRPPSSSSGPKSSSVENRVDLPLDE
jgi:ArsR family transcriptional regulator